MADEIKKIYPKWSVKYNALSNVLDPAADNYLPKEGRMVIIDNHWTTFIHLGVVSFDPAFSRPPPVVVKAKKKSKKSAKKSENKES